MQQQPVMTQQPVAAQAQKQQRMPGPARAKPCAAKPCKNKSVCANVRDKSGSAFTCVCKAGWEGTMCETSLKTAAGKAKLHLDAGIEFKSGTGGERVSEKAVLDGAAQAGFSEDDASFVVDTDHVKITLKNVGELPLDFKQPALISQHPEVISPTLV